MRSNKTARLVAVTAVGMALLLGMVLTADRRRSNHANATGVPVSPPDASPARGAAERSTSSAASLSTLDAAQWDQLSATERTRLLTRQFERAVARLERDRGDAEGLEDARDALSLLRSELRVDEAGTRRHAVLEERLEALTEAP
jgi:hypothetical protein